MLLTMGDEKVCRVCGTARPVTIGNLVPACASCNHSKKDKTVTEWRIWKAATRA